MKKIVSVVMLSVFALAFVGGVAVSNVDARPTGSKCTSTCINGVMWTCCTYYDNPGKPKTECWSGDYCY